MLLADKAQHSRRFSSLERFCSKMGIFKKVQAAALHSGIGTALPHLHGAKPGHQHYVISNCHQLTTMQLRCLRRHPKEQHYVLMTPSRPSSLSAQSPSWVQLSCGGQGCMQGPQPLCGTVVKASVWRCTIEGKHTEWCLCSFC